MYISYRSRTSFITASTIPDRGTTRELVCIIPPPVPLNAPTDTKTSPGSRPASSAGEPGATFFFGQRERDQFRYVGETHLGASIARI